MTLTRRTPRFGELAAGAEERLAQLGIVVDPNGIDEDLRARVRAVADHLGVTDRTALRYATDSLSDEIAKTFVLALRSLGENYGTEISAPRERHLRVVR